MLYYQEQSVLSLNETMRCEIMTRRYWEVKYMVDRNKNDFALHIVFNGLRDLLGTCKIGEERIIDMKERTEICNHLLDAVTVRYACCFFVEEAAHCPYCF